MPRAHGNDRLEILKGGRYRIVSPASKGWRATRPASRTTAEFPGTAVAWDGSIWEVVSTENRGQGAVAYVLAPWKDHHAIRVTVDYDSASERALAAEAAREASRTRVSLFVVGTGVVTGHLPAHLQRGIENEYGISAVKLTLLSLIPQLSIAAVAATGIPIEGLQGPKWPLWFIAVGCVAFAEMMLRGWYCLSRSQPLGSIEGLLGWKAACSVSNRAAAFDRASKRAIERQISTTSVMPPGDYERERDDYAMREPLLALLPAEAQLRLSATFGFDPIAWGIRTAATIALFSGAGIGSAASKIADGTAGGGTWLSLAIALILFGEQVKRLAGLRRGRPQESLLGALVQPFCARLLATEPRAIEKGTTAKLQTKLPEVWDGGSPDGEDDQTGR